MGEGAGERTCWLLVQRQDRQPPEARWLVLGWGTDEGRIRELATRVRRGLRAAVAAGKVAAGARGSVLVVPYVRRWPGEGLPTQLAQGPDGLPVVSVLVAVWRDGKEEPSE